MTYSQSRHSYSCKFNPKLNCAPLAQAAVEVETMDHFVADVAHDLRNPLAAMKMRLYLLQHRPEQLNEHLKIMEYHIDQMAHLVDELQTLSGPERGDLELDYSEVDINELIAEVVETHCTLAMDKNQQLDFQHHANLPLIVADASKCKRIVANLVANALNYTPTGGTVLVKTDLDGDALLISVTDSGLGISAEDLPHIFERFYRASHAQQTGISGTGLGLAIVNDIVALHGGHITVESALDEGTTFIVSLPLIRSNEPAPLQ